MAIALDGAAMMVGLVAAEDHDMAETVSTAQPPPRLGMHRRPDLVRSHRTMER